ncbi:MAG: DNA primase [Thaumarchaeota archaeon]|nr:DNA primase [Nitrososphaerota archaeon]
MVRLRFNIEGVVEKADIIGAIFGQTEGLFGPEMNLNELQKSYKLGRIEINLDSKEGRTHGEVLLPMSTDISTAALIAAAVESVDKVGPCGARFHLEAIEDVRASKRKSIAERAKLIVKDWSSKVSSEGEEVLKDVMEAQKRGKLISFGKEGLPAGVGIYTSETVILVEGRADVITLLRAGIENGIALEGAKIPDSIVKLSREKTVIAFLDGDRGGDIILRELQQMARISRVIRAPNGREVEDLTPVEILDLLREVLPGARREAVAPEAKVEGALADKVREIHPHIGGTLEAVILNNDFQEVKKVPVSELIPALENDNGVKHVIFDGIVTQRLVDACGKVGINTLVGHRVGSLTNRPDQLAIHTFRDFGLDSG